MTGRSGNNGSGLRAIGAVVVSAFLLSGCSDMFAGMSLPSLPKMDDLNPFAEKEVPLPGKRISVMQKEAAGELASADRPIALPAQRQNADWTQPGGSPNNAPGHLALGQAVKSAWSADAGTGSSFYGKLTSSPIVYDNKVFTLDAAGKVSAFSLSGGSALWRVSTTPPNEKDQEGFGGGLAADGGRIYAATGFGLVVALEPASGKKLWEKSVGSPVRASPTAAGERVFVVTMEGQTFCLSGSDGTELWTFRGMPERARILTNSSPAVDGDIVVFPYPTGDVVALQASTGQPVWSESLARTRTGSSLAAMSDTARPVHRRRHGVRCRSCRPHGGDLAEDRRAAVVAIGAGHPGTVGGRRFRVRGRHRRTAAGRRPARRQGAVVRQAAGHRDLVGTGAGRQSAVACVEHRPAGRGGRQHGAGGYHAGSRPARLYRARSWLRGACSC